MMLDDRWDDDAEDEEAWSDDDEADSGTVECPECGGDVYDDADQCPACGYWLLDADGPAAWSVARPATLRLVAAIVLIGFVLSILAGAGLLF